MGRAHSIGPVPRVLLFLVFLLAVSVGPPARAGDATYLEELRSRARELRLAEAREWRILGHYAPNTLRPGATSEADSPLFFLSPDGKTDPRAELDATLAAFFEPADRRIRLDDHPQCAYPARREWLDARLGFDRTRLPWRECPDLDEWIDGIGAEGLTLVFSEAFMNNPASMFGHTLLRVDAEPPGTDRRRDLLAYSVNFAGDAGGDQGALYAINGIIGAYPGYFSLVPYYDKINQYVRWESRGLWEYRLDFSPDEVARLLMHLWELRDIAFQYFFFSENCSYQLLGLLEAARPELDLSGGYAGLVVPIETVRSIVEQAGIAAEVAWRPSVVDEIRNLASALSPEQRSMAAAISEGATEPDAPEIEALPPKTRAIVLSAAADKINYESGQGDAEARERLLAVLRARSGTRVRGDPVPKPERPAVQPHEGHGSSRLRLSGGAVDGRSYVELRGRLAFHDLLDPQGGFLEGAQIDFMDTAVRYHPDDGEFDFHEFTLVNLQSLSPRDAFFQPISWKFRTGLATRRQPSAVVDELRESKLWRTSGGAGMTLRPWRNTLAYAFLDGTLDVSGKLDDNYGIGLGATLGVYTGDPSDRWRGHLFARAMRFVAGDTRSAFQVGLEQRVRITRNHALRLHVTGERDFRETWVDVGLGWDFYF